MAPNPLVVLCTCPNNTVAAEIATALVEQRLAACVNRVPGVKSWYRWQDEVRQDEEVLLLIKTLPERVGEIEQMLKKLHPYEIPELIGMSVTTGSTAYLAWLAEGSLP